MSGRSLLSLLLQRPRWKSKVMLKLVMVLAVASGAPFGCAEPKYVQGKRGTDGSVSQREAGVGCLERFISSGLCLTWYWQKAPAPPRGGSSGGPEEAVLVFKVFRPNLLDQTPVEVDLSVLPLVSLWMPSMGHGSTPTETVRIDIGTYRTSKVNFIMPGDWEIRIQVKNGAEVVDHAVIRLDL